MPRHNRQPRPGWECVFSNDRCPGTLCVSTGAAGEVQAYVARAGRQWCNHHETCRRDHSASGRNGHSNDRRGLYRELAAALAGRPRPSQEHADRGVHAHARPRASRANYARSPGARSVGAVTGDSSQDADVRGYELVEGADGVWTADGVQAGTTYALESRAMDVAATNGLSPFIAYGQTSVTMPAEPSTGQIDAGELVLQRAKPSAVRVEAK